MKIFQHRFGKMRSWHWVFALAMLALLMYAEITVGEIRFTLLYYLPIFVLAWKVSFKAALLYTIPLAFAWGLGDFYGIAGSTIVNSSINAFIKWITYAIFSFVTAGVHFFILEQIRLTRELEAANESLNTLEKLLPICANCKKIQDEQNSWMDVEEYLKKQTQRDLTHGICPDCFNKAMKMLEENEISEPHPAATHNN